MERTEQQLLELWKQVFGDTEGFWERFFDCVYEDSHCLRLEEEGQLQAALYWFDCDCGGPWAYVFAVATHPSHRGKGLCRKLMEKTHTHLKALGYCGALLVPAEEGLRRMYEKMGYREGTTLDTFSLEASETAIPLHCLTPASYLLARQEFLPAASVLQKKDTFTLLARTGIRFYAGEDFLMAGEFGREAQVLEYLGDKSRASDALAALGCGKGAFRSPGGRIPFAMVHPFREDVQIPQYFAFAFD